MAHVRRWQACPPPAPLRPHHAACEGNFQTHTAAAGQPVQTQQQQQPTWANASLVSSPWPTCHQKQRRPESCCCSSSSNSSSSGGEDSTSQCLNSFSPATSDRMAPPPEHTRPSTGAAADGVSGSDGMFCGTESYEMRPSSDGGSWDGLMQPETDCNDMHQAPAKPQIRSELVRQVALKLFEAVLVADAARPNPAAALLQQQPAQLHALLQELQQQQQQQPTPPQTPSKQQTGGIRRQPSFDAVDHGRAPFSTMTEHPFGAADSGELYMHSSNSAALMLALDDDCGGGTGGASSLSGMQLPAACEVVSLSASSSHASAWSDEGVQVAHGSNGTSSGSQAAAAMEEAATAPGQEVLQGLLVRLRELRTSIQRSNGRVHTGQVDRLSCLADEIAAASRDVAAACGSQHPVSLQLTALQNGLEQWRTACSVGAAGMSPACAGPASAGSSNGSEHGDNAGLALDAEASAAALGQESSFQAWQQAGTSQQVEPPAPCVPWQAATCSLSLRGSVCAGPVSASSSLGFGGLYAARLEQAHGGEAGAVAAHGLEGGGSMGSRVVRSNLKGAYSTFGTSYAEKRRCFMQALKQSLKESLERVATDRC